ncbi:cellulose biosynthesis protein BcsS [Methylorubrum sp. SL192]|uniref:cellulose biosynthesis protein BcsS n=1 Tax=Methylorubrum sp. SL192 TaxID=2995167 RepID=UPI002DD42326|nr:cellulose biosynthesis protein BcsS [Methylorubrum sp. SL192]
MSKRASSRDGLRHPAPSGRAASRRALAALAPFVILACDPARADDASLRTVLFGSMDAGASTFSAAGAKLVFDRFDRDGPVALVTAGGGVRLEGGGGMPVLMRFTALGAALGGYQFIREWGAVTVFAGPEASWEALSGPGFVQALPLRAGFRLHGEVWARPTETTLMTATVILGSARGDAYARLSWGTALFGAYLGPEAAIYGDQTDYRKWSLGLHVTDYAMGGYRFRLSAGGQLETPLNQWNPYVSLAVWSAL